MVITRRRVETSQDQQSPQYCSWLFPGLDLQVWVTCPAGGHRVYLLRTRALFFRSKRLKGSTTSSGYLLLPGRLLFDSGWGACAVLQWVGSDAGSATVTTPHWGDPGTEFRSDCSPQTHLQTITWSKL